MFKKYGNFPQRKFSGNWNNYFQYYAQVEKTKEKVKVNILFNEPVYSSENAKIIKIEII